MRGKTIDLRGDSKTAALAIYDTSSVIEASNRGEKISGYTIPLILDEMHYFLPGNGRNGTHIKPEYIQGISTDLPGTSNYSTTISVRQDVLLANERANQGKKTDIDKISLPDIALVTKAVSLAASGVPVAVWSEDAHVTNTVSEMLAQPEYSDLKPYLSVKSYRSKTGA